ncbi:MAG: hypothetical protein GTN93_10515 [Anaerolineae bacterium]|nr:hypothetical protein [Anaerolineae bacterium]
MKKKVPLEQHVKALKAKVEPKGYKVYTTEGEDGSINLCMSKTIKSKPPTEEQRKKFEADFAEFKKKLDKAPRIKKDGKIFAVLEMPNGKPPILMQVPK